MKTILFPTDLSDAANKAYVYALHLADKLQARLLSLHVFDKPDIRGASHLPRLLEEFYEQFDLYEFESFRDSIPHLDKIAEEQGLSHIEVSHLLEEGETVETILRVAEREKADLIVMGTTGARGLKEVFVGSVAGEILENASCPVLSVPEEAHFDGRVDRVAISTAFQPEDEKALLLLQQLTAPFEAEIHCVYIDMAHTEDHNHRMEDLRANFADDSRMYFHVVEGTDFLPAFTSFLTDRSIDWTAMIAHKRSFWQELFHYSKAKSMSYHSQTPTLSFPEGLLA